MKCPIDREVRWLSLADKREDRDYEKKFKWLFLQEARLTRRIAAGSIAKAEK